VGVAPGEGERELPPRPVEGAPPARAGGAPPPVAGELPARVMWIVAGAIGAMYATSSILRGEVLPGFVGGVLAAILCVLVLREVRERRRRRARGGR